MPTYVYECKSCEKVFEVEQRIVEDALTDCDCGKKGTLRRLIQPTAVMFKGSGFYVNDAGKSTGSDEGSSSSSVKSDEGAGSGGEGKKETPKKEEAKAEPSGSDKTDKK